MIKGVTPELCVFDMHTSRPTAQVFPTECRHPGKESCHKLSLAHSINDHMVNLWKYSGIVLASIYDWMPKTLAGQKGSHVRLSHECGEPRTLIAQVSNGSSNDTMRGSASFSCPKVCLRSPRLSLGEAEWTIGLDVKAGRELDDDCPTISQRSSSALCIATL